MHPIKQCNFVFFTQFFHQFYLVQKNLKNIFLKTKQEYGFHTQTQSQHHTEYTVINTQLNKWTSFNQNNKNSIQSALHLLPLYIMECLGLHYSYFCPNSVLVAKYGWLMNTWILLLSLSSSLLLFSLFWISIQKHQRAVSIYFTRNPTIKFSPGSQCKRWFV